MSLLYRIGDYEECKAWIEKSLKDFPHQAAIRELKVQLEANMKRVPATFMRSKARAVLPHQRVLKLEQLSWLALGQLLLQSEQATNNEEAEVDPLLPEPIIVIEPTEESKVALKEKVTTPKKKKQKLPPVLATVRTSNRISEKKNQNEFLDFFNECFDQNVLPFVLAKRTRMRNNATCKADDVECSEANSVFRFLQEYANVPSNGNIIERGNTGLIHLVNLFLTALFEQVVVTKWEFSLQQLLLDLNALRKQSYDTIEPVCTLCSVNKTLTPKNSLS